MDFRNPIFTASGAIDCEIDHPVYGWVPFTADPNDSEPLGAKIFNAAKASAAPYTPPPPPSDDELAALARRERDRLLTASDWTQVADAPVDAAAWAVYRQALRDVPQQEGFPETIIWPNPPA